MSAQSISDFGLNFIVSSIATTVVAPIDRVKLILQVQPSLCSHTSSLQKDRFTGAVDCLRQIRAQQGFRSLWNGNTAGVLRFVPGQIVTLALNDRFKGMLNQDSSHRVSFFL
jgi:solute carrier family 25 (adenine nucleotide translocator) protein 4/5/6/31